MIDFIKYELINTSPTELELNTYLEFHQKVNTKTGELGVYMNAYYKGLEFKIYESSDAHPNKRITVEGSIHKYWNNGAHNFNDFGINQINEVLNELKQTFKIEPVNCVLKQLEIGVNITPPQNTKPILDHCIMHKTKRLKSVYTKDEGNYIQVHNQRYFLKLYDKMTHYKNKGFKIYTEIMRIEIKYSRMKFLNDLMMPFINDSFVYHSAQIKI